MNLKHQKNLNLGGNIYLIGNMKKIKIDKNEKEYILSMYNILKEDDSFSKSIPNEEVKVDCQSIDVDGTNWCDKISVHHEVNIATNKKDPGCSAFATNCLRKFDKKLYAGDAWDALENLRNSGNKVKFNVYDKLDWSKIRDLVKKNKITKSTCNTYFTSLKSDPKNMVLKDMITSIMPKSINFDIKSLKLGDFIGVYYPSSNSQGKAFCDKIIEKKLNEKSEYNSGAFTFNTHVEFVGAIKDGQPIMYHQTYDKWKATPAKLMKEANHLGMIAWVVENDTIVQETKKIKIVPTEKDKRSWQEWYDSLW